MSWKQWGPSSLPSAIEIMNVDEVRPERLTALMRNVPEEMCARTGMGWS